MDLALTVECVSFKCGCTYARGIGMTYTCEMNVGVYEHTRRSGEKSNKRATKAAQKSYKSNPLPPKYGRNAPSAAKMTQKELIY